MKRAFAALLLILSVGCDDPKEDVQPSTVIEGLELTFLETPFVQPPWAIEFISETTGFLATLNGEMMKTTDSGVTWKKITTNTTAPFFDIHFINTNEGWAVAGDGDCLDNHCASPGPLMLHTVDGGETWAPVNLGTDNLLASVWFVNDQLGFSVGSSSILRTTNGGESWSETIIENPNPSLMNVQFFDENHGIITGFFETVYKTSDGGDTWEVFDQYTDFGAYSLALAGEATAYGSLDKEIHRSLDGGETWAPLYTFDKLSIVSLNFISETTGFAVGPGTWTPGDPGHGTAAIYYTKDAGQSWTGTVEVQEMQTVVRTSFPTSTVGYGVGGTTLVRIKLK